MMVMDYGATWWAIIVTVTVVVLAMIAMVAVTTTLFHTLNAKYESFRADLAAHQQATKAQMESIQSTVAKGIEEHKTCTRSWTKPNARLDQLWMHLLERKN